MNGKRRQGRRELFYTCAELHVERMALADPGAWVALKARNSRERTWAPARPRDFRLSASSKAICAPNSSLHDLLIRN